MHKEVRYILTEDEATCVEDIETAKRNLDMMADQILQEQEIPSEYADFLYRVSSRLSIALEKLDLE